MDWHSTHDSVQALAAFACAQGANAWYLHPERRGCPKMAAAINEIVMQEPT